MKREFLPLKSFMFLFQSDQPTTPKMRIPTLSVFAVFALLGMALGMGSYGYGSLGYGGFGSSYVPVAVGSGYGAGGIGSSGIRK